MRTKLAPFRLVGPPHLRTTGILLQKQLQKLHCSYSTSTVEASPVANQQRPPHHAEAKPPPLSLMPTSALLRSYFITSVLASPSTMKLVLPIMHKIANSQSIFLNPDRNPVLHFLVRHVVYDHFTAGETTADVKRTVSQMKDIGFKGVILGYAKEVNVTGGETYMAAIDSSAPDPSLPAINEWKEGTLKTLSMIGEGDFLAVKYSGAGLSTLEALRNNADPPPLMWAAMLEICEAVKKQKSRMWIDAEQQDLQSTIDRWTIDLMRNYNGEDDPIVYTTMQAYLKHTRNNILEHLRLAQEEGWILGIKLVRGAYIATEKRDLIHNTIQDTHNAYNAIMKDIMTQSYSGLPSGIAFPRVALMLATHNDESVQKGTSIQRSCVEAEKTIVDVSFAQLQGMADEISCGLLQMCQAVQPGEKDPKKLALAPKVFKCLTHGTTQECLQFLLRRVKENTDALGRTKIWMAAFRRELWRRTRAVVTFS